MPNTQQVGWWSRMTNAVADFPPLKKGGEGGFKDSYQELSTCKGPIDCLAQKFGSSMWAPLAAVFGGLKMLDARERNMTWNGAIRQVEQGEAYVRSGNMVDAARMMGEASAMFHELDEAYLEAQAKERQGDILRHVGYGGFIAKAQEAYDRAAAIYGELIKTDGSTVGFELRRGLLFEKAGRPSEAAKIYDRVAKRYHPTSSLREDIALALVRVGRYKEAVEALERSNIWAVREGIKKMAVADSLAREAANGQPESATAPNVFKKWERAREAFYDAARTYRRGRGIGRSYELEALALDRTLEAARWAAATHNGRGYDNRSLQAKYLRQRSIVLGKAGLHKKAADALEEEAVIRGQIGDKKGLATARALRKKRLARARSVLKEGAINMRGLKSDSVRRIMAIHQFVSPVDPRMFRDASSVRSARQILANLVAPGRDVEKTMVSIITGDWRLVEGLDERRVVSLLPSADWESLIRTARLLKNAGVNILVGSFDRFHILAQLSLDEKRRFAEAWLAEYGLLSSSQRAKYGEPKEGEILPAKFISAMVAKISTVNSLEVKKAFGSLDGGRPLTSKGISVTKPAVDIDAGKGPVGKARQTRGIAEGIVPRAVEARDAALRDARKGRKK